MQKKNSSRKPDNGKSSRPSSHGKNQSAHRPKHTDKRSSTNGTPKAAPFRKKKAAPAIVHEDDSISVNKYISDSGFCSRREADRFIEEGRASINGKTAVKGNRVYPGDVVEVDGETLKKASKTIYMAFNKPTGITTTTDLQDKTNIIQYIGYPQRIFPIGRLDKDSEGLILLTNDGDIVNKILRAGNNHEKEYIVQVNKPVTHEMVNGMRNGVPVLGTVTLPCEVVREGKNILRIKLVQGLNRQIRRMCEYFGYEVIRLKRIRIMNITLSNLQSGTYRMLTSEEIKDMLRLVTDSRS